MTGAGGFVGSYLVRELLRVRDAVVGFAEGAVAEGVDCYDVDIRDAERVRRVVEEEGPDEIYHLAAIAHPATDAGPGDVYRVNVVGTVNVLEAARSVGASVLLVSSAYVYGRQDGPINERRPLAPIDHYGASKAASELAARPFVRQGVRVICVRPFNHTGPGQVPEYLLPSIVHRLVRMERGLEASVLHLGNLDAVRDFTDVRDVARAYPAVLDAGEAGEVYNLASGEAWSVRELLDLTLEHTSVTPEVRVEEARLRPVDIPRLVGDATRLEARLDWRRQYTLRETIAAMFKWERAAQGRSGE